jgi:hypothetical protein
MRLLLEYFKLVTHSDNSKIFCECTYLKREEIGKEKICLDLADEQEVHLGEALAGMLFRLHGVTLKVHV